jgi:ankyrin repeat protein
MNKSTQSSDSGVSSYARTDSRESTRSSSSRSREPTEEELTIRKFLKAVQAGNVEEFTALHEAGVDVDTPNVLGETGLMLACKVGNLAIAEKLIQWGANVHARSNEGRTCLTYASRYGHDDCVSRLILAGASVNAANNDGYTPLMKATCYGHVSVVDWLLAAGADVHKRNNDGRTALNLTKVLKQNEIRKKLEVFAAQQSPRPVTDLSPKKSVVGVFWKAYEAGNVCMAKNLLEAGIEVNTTKPYAGNTGLILASKVGDMEMVEKLLAAGADLHASNEEGDNSLILACRYGHPNVVSKLLAAGADADATNNRGYTAMMKAVVGRHVKCLDLLLDNGADYLAQNKDGRSAFDLASIFGEQEIRAKLRILE